ncbi:MAG: acylphosphatase [Candidatus Marinimicrobia bacterium]|nr:acylphosphatase [Candidatus Neomarinimicrobiota bacterium]
MKIHAEIIVQGFVQGIGYRYFTLRKARDYNLVGYVKNLMNGDVLCEVEGEEGLVNDFIKELRIGPTFSRVTNIVVEKSNTLEGYTTFEVRF